MMEDGSVLRDQVLALLDDRAALKEGDWSAALEYRQRLAVLLTYMVEGAELPPVGQTRSEQLDRLSFKVELAGALIQGAGEISGSEPAREISFIAAGDAPNLLAPDNRQRLRGNAAALAVHQMRALEWNAFLDALGWSAGQRQARIADSYGSTWDAIRRWPVPARRIFGAVVFDRRIASAREAGEQRRRGTALSDYVSVLMDPWGGANPSAQLQIDGSAYLVAIGFAAG